MVSRQNRLLGSVLAFGLVSCGLGACSSSSNGGNGGNGGSPASGGKTSSGGVTSAGGSSTKGGATASGGSVGTGGTQATGGAVGSGGSASGGATTGTGGASPAGGTTGSGGAAAGGATDAGAGGLGKGGNVTSTGGMGPGGGMGNGGMGAGGKTGTGGAAGGGSGGAGGGSGGSSGTCQKGKVAAKEVVFMGESFYAIAPQYIQNRIQDDARKAGSLAAGDSYRNVAVSGQPMSYIAGAEWDAIKNSTVKLIIMDGGGIDCMSSPCPTCPDAFKTLLGQMATAGVQDVIYTRYPEPGNPPGSNATLKGNLDTLMPKMQTVCEGSTSPLCHWVDLRPVWVNGDTSDGLHPTQSGGEHVGDLIWSRMVKDCLAQ